MDWLRSAAIDTPDAPAMAVGGDTLTYEHLDATADAVASTLIGSGLTPGGRVVFPAEATLAFVAAVWGIPRAGGAAVPLDRRLPPGESLRRTRGLGAAVWAPTSEGWRARPARRPMSWGPPDADAGYVVFTSGTGGEAQGAVLTGTMIEASVTAARSRLGNDAADRWLCVLPLHHVGGLSILWRSVQAGGCVVLEDRFDARRCAGMMRDGEVTVASLVPTMLVRILEADPGPYRGLRAVLVGGGPTDVDLIRRARAAGIPALQTYGTTETTSQIATEDLETDGEPGTAGRPLDGIEVRIVDDDAVPVPVGEPGRIQVLGPVVFPGYAGEPGRVPGTWMETRDLGLLDGAGRLVVLGRSDDVVVSGGENVAPAEVERALRPIPGVVDVRVRGADDPEWGRVVAADVVLEPGVSVDSIREAARARLAPHQIPKRWRVADRIDRGWKHTLASPPEHPEPDQGSP